MFYHISEHLLTCGSWKYSAQWSNFDELQGVWNTKNTDFGIQFDTRYISVTQTNKN